MPPLYHAGQSSTFMHIAIKEKLDGKAVDWLEHVVDEQYGGRGESK